jgi:NifU-like protein involved in Fe-S cluster formation
MYSPQVLDHFEKPRNAGVVENADCSVQLENPACGDVLRLTARMQGECISEIRFQAKGCVPSMACASAVTELVAGKGVSDAEQLTRQSLESYLGGLPQASSHAAHLAIDALAALIRKSKNTAGRLSSAR